MFKPELPSNSGTYSLIIDVSRPVSVEAGKLGLSSFNTGLYAYTGSAIGRSVNLRRRVSRHLTTVKKRHWHIDYLLGCDGVVVRAIVFAEGNLRMECAVAKSLEQSADAKVLVKGFGSSDCRSGCVAHLSYFPGLHLERVISRVAGIYETVCNGAQNVHLLYV